MGFVQGTLFIKDGHQSNPPPPFTPPLPSVFPCDHNNNIQWAVLSLAYAYYVVKDVRNKNWSHWSHFIYKIYKAAILSSD